MHGTPPCWVKGTILKIMRSWHQFLATFLRPSGQIRNICCTSLIHNWIYNFYPRNEKEGSFRGTHIVEGKKLGDCDLVPNTCPVLLPTPCSPRLAIASLKIPKATRILQSQSSVSLSFCPMMHLWTLVDLIVQLNYYHLFVIADLPSLKKDAWVQVHIFCIVYVPTWSNPIMFIWSMILFSLCSEIYWSLTIYSTLSAIVCASAYWALIYIGNCKQAMLIIITQDILRIFFLDGSCKWQPSLLVTSQLPRLL